jgi:diguanylate cyclase (GGDEF)-like protein
MPQSLTRHTSLAAMLVAILIISAALMNQYLLATQSRDYAEAEAQVSFRSYHYAVGNQIGFYRSLVNRLAHRADVQDLLAFADAREAFLWASGYRKLLPDAIGLALIRADGKVLGDPVSLFLGPACVRDIERLADNDFTGVASVHRDNEELAHFDIMAPAKDAEGEVLGYLFVSFSLEVLADFANNIIRDGHRLTLHDQNGQLIVAANQLTDAGKTPIVVSGPLPDTYWKLTLESQSIDLGASVAVLDATAVLLAVVVAGAIILLMRSVSKRALAELRGIQCALTGIAEDKANDRPIQAGFVETRAMVEAIGEISNRIQNQKLRLSRLSDTDELTGLLNRRRFRSELEKVWQLCRQGSKASLLCLDLDGFKRINDEFGHQVGDQLLTLLGDCIQRSVRQGDIAARIGGDEFVVLIPDPGTDACANLFERICACFGASQRHMVGSGDSQPCTLSAGLANLEPALDCGPAAALRRADAALYRAKRLGKNRLCLDSDATDARELAARDCQSA